MKLISQGKVRDTYEYEYPENTVYNELAIVASDRVSAFDKVIPGLEIEGKGRILTAMSAEWADIIDRYYAEAAIRPVTSVDRPVYTSYQECSKGQENELKAAGLDLSCVQSQDRLAMIPVECIVRGYITGSLWEAYDKDGLREFCGVPLPDGLKESDKLPEPIFTPTTKAPVGQHDENITLDQMAELIEDAFSPEFLCDYEWSTNPGMDIAKAIKEVSLFYFMQASAYAEIHGIILADTKFEFGFGFGVKPELRLGDEILTPDSSRFWPAADYEPGRPQKSLDKQIIRDYIKAQKAAGATEITLPDEIIKQTQQAYQQIYEMLSKKGSLKKTKDFKAN